MLRSDTSIRKKIVLAFILNFVFIGLIAVITIFNLVRIERRLDFNAVISRFLDATLELRRFEKNFFLYRNKVDFTEAVLYISTIETIIRKHRNDFDGSSRIKDWTVNIFKKNRIPTGSSESVSNHILRLAHEYRKLINKAFTAQSDFKRLEEEIRRKGRELTETAEKHAQTERAGIQEMFSATRKNLVILVVFFIIGISLIGKLISSIAIRPLKELEMSMRRISSGNFEMLSLQSKNDEIVSINRAFNKMMKELFAQKDIIRSEKLTSLGTMLAGIAHEINNPLSNISTSAEILFEEFDNLDPEYRKELIDQVVRETDRAKDIVRSVLEYTRDREFRKSEVKLLNLVSETMRFVRSDMPPHITLTVDIPEGLIVNVDKQKIQHALLNLIKNSIDAIPDKNSEEKITIKAEEYNNREVKIMITDTGVGIPEATIERIFDPFFTTKDIGKGTGLGLFVSHYIIEQHNGTISVSSRPGKGTTFTIILPAKGREQ